MEIGERISALRTERNWSQEDLAAAAEETKASIRDWEKGTSLPKLDQLIHLSMIFEVPLSELLGDQAGAYDLEQAVDPRKEAEKKKKDRILFMLKLLVVGIAVLLAILVNLVWFKFLNRFL